MPLPLFIRLASAHLPSPIISLSFSLFFLFLFPSPIPLPFLLSHFLFISSFLRFTFHLPFLLIPPLPQFLFSFHSSLYPPFLCPKSSSPSSLPFSSPPHLQFLFPFLSLSQFLFSPFLTVSLYRLAPSSPSPNNVKGFLTLPPSPFSLLFLLPFSSFFLPLLILFLFLFHLIFLFVFVFVVFFSSSSSPSPSNNFSPLSFPLPIPLTTYLPHIPYPTPLSPNASSFYSFFFTLPSYLPLLPFISFRYLLSSSLSFNSLLPPLLSPPSSIPFSPLPSSPPLPLPPPPLGCCIMENSSRTFLSFRYSMEFETLVDVPSGREIRPRLSATNVFYRKKNIVLENGSFAASATSYCFAKRSHSRKVARSHLIFN
ncbi:hypothetical protein C7M84_003101 [Penaeus vannamei]|uniref:Uncharacterized protein n=1 Tax=Penaeus vannamei TaxID=6689 RepID=A0A3R7N615_PENVA|nr:hypothetical protein C7M84_003101 [Penaeus vannamei]